MLKRLIIRWIVLGLSLLVVAYLVPGFRFNAPQTAFIAAVVLGLVNGTLGAVIKFFTFPLTLLTLGLFWFLINAAMLGITSALVDGFSISGPVTAIIGAVLLSIVNLILRTVLPDGRDD